MNKITELVLKEIHPNWIPLFQTISFNMVDLLDQTISNIIKTGNKLCPDHPSKILKCLSVNPDVVSAVIIGQECYPQPGIATGYSFACEGKWQPSLNIMVRELSNQYNDETILDTFDGTLKPWIDQGVILLNAGLTCEQWKPNSHINLWNPFMTKLITVLNDLKISRESMDSIVFVFLGKIAASYESLISNKLHYKIFRNHPAAETHGDLKFEGFYKEVNHYLSETNREIKWY